MAARKILIVDDDPVLLELLELRLRTEGFDVRAAASGERALALLPTFRPELVVTDMKMGGMDGLALFEAVHKATPALPVIMLTAHGSIPDALTATRRGVFGYLTKPFEAAALLAEVERAFALYATARDTASAPAGGADSWRESIVTASAAMEALLAEAKLVAATDASVILSGASGTGKELFARAIHRASGRRERPFVAVNCGAIPEPLLESELFGHVKGAFTGAAREHQGLFLAAQGGTVFLDEIGDMPLALQVKLLRVLQEREVRPVGAVHSLAVDVRIISATHRDLGEQITAGRFREDLYYRLNVVGLKLPPLSERREDIPLLAARFLQSLAGRYGKDVNGFAPEATALLVRADWPGNVRQLYNAVEKIVALATSPVVPPQLAQRALDRDGGELDSLDDAKRAFERDYLVRLLKLTGGNVTHAARLARRNRSEFYALLKRHELEPGQFKA